MPSVLGKRKQPRLTSEEASTARAQAQAIFQRHFEAQFAPLPQMGVSEAADDDHDVVVSVAETETGPSDAEPGYEMECESGQDRVPDNEDDDRNDLSDSDSETTDSVEIVDYSKTAPETKPTMTKSERKKLLSSKPPSHDPSDKDASSIRVTRQKKGGKESEDEDSEAFLAKDLELQRLISESHILSAAGGNAAYYTSAGSSACGPAGADRLFAAGKVRKLTTDMRLQALGAKGSVLRQANMPMAMRKGLAAAAAAREEKRRREARENGIVLERPSASANKNKAKRKTVGARAVDLPAVGKMRGSELRISNRDIRAVEAAGRAPVGRGRHKRRR